MNRKMNRAFAMLVLSFAAAAKALAQDPRIDRVEPPSWWTTTRPQQVTLLFEGRGLDQAAVEIDGGVVSVGRVEHGSGGGALVADVTIPSGAQPGKLRLRVRANGKVLEAPWALDAETGHRPDPFGPDDVIYLIMPDRFADGDSSINEVDGGDRMLDRKSMDAYHGGDFQGIRKRLPYLKQLGVTAIWLTPIYRPDPHWLVFPSGGPPGPGGRPGMRRMAEYHGYAPVDFFDANPRFGTLDDYRQLVVETHRLGLKIIQDQIVGYTGPRHRWVNSPPSGGWFNGPMDRPPSCNFRFDALANPHADPADRHGMTDGWFFGILPDLDTGNPLVRRYAIQQSIWWAKRFSVDGIRLDTYPMVERSFWRDWSRDREAAVPGLSVGGEAWVTDPALLAFFQGGRTGWDGIDTGVGWLFDFPLYQAIVEVFAGKRPVSRLAQVLARDGLYPRPDRLVTFLDNHDTVRLAGMPGMTPGRYRAAIAFLLTCRGVPQMTWGDELGMPGHMDDRRDFPGGFPGDSRNAFEPAGRTALEQETFETWIKLIRLRQSTPALRRGRQIDLSVSDTTYAFLRELDDERVVAVLNLAAGPATVRIPAQRINGAARFETLYGASSGRIDADGLSIELPGTSATVLRLTPPLKLAGADRVIAVAHPSTHLRFLPRAGASGSFLRLVQGAQKHSGACAHRRVVRGDNASQNGDRQTGLADFDQNRGTREALVEVLARHHRLKQRIALLIGDSHQDQRPHRGNSLVRNSAAQMRAKLRLQLPGNDFDHREVSQGVEPVCPFLLANDSRHRRDNALRLR